MKNIWSSKDEEEHFQSIMEWWSIIVFLRTKDEKKQFSFKGTLTEWCKKSKVGSIINTTFFNLNNSNYFTFSSKNDTKKLEYSKDTSEIKYDTSFIRGKFPNYDVVFKDKKNDIKVNLKLKAKFNSHWVAKDITKGYLPMGFGFFRYGFIPKCSTNGTISIKNEIYHVEGEAYFEHVWGDIWYDNPLSCLSNIKESIFIYSKLIFWWLKNHKLSIPNNIKLTTENNPFGYDWIWIIFENGWSIYFGNLLFWLMEGPVMGTLSLFKNKNDFIEFPKVTFNYRKKGYSKDYDFCYPIEIEVFAKNKQESIHLFIKKTMKSREYLSNFSEGKYWKYFVLSEAPGIVKAKYKKCNNVIKLSGICKIESQRQISILGHNSVKLKILKPPKEIGISFSLNSHYFKKKILVQIQLTPKLAFKTEMKRTLFFENHEK